MVSPVLLFCSLAPRAAPLGAFTAIVYVQRQDFKTKYALSAFFGSCTFQRNVSCHTF